MPTALLNRLSAPTTIQAINKYLSVLMNILLVLAIAWLLAKISWLFFPQQTIMRAQPVPQKQIFRQASPQNFRRLTAAHIFGINQTTAVLIPVKAPETKLNLTLKGVLAANPMKRATAIIARGRNGKETIYGIGDKISTGVSIKEIHPEYIVLNRGGRSEILKLPKQSGLNQSGFNRTGGNHINRFSQRSPGQALAQIRQNILRSPTSFGDYALPIVVRQNGKQMGYRLQPQAKGQLLAQLGLQPNDIITRINGVELNKPQNGITALRKLSTANQLNLVVNRNGTEVPLYIQLK